MVYAKCIKIDRPNKKYLLKDCNGLEMWVTEKQLYTARLESKITIINLDSNLEFKVDIDSYELMTSDDKHSTDALAMHNKSLLIGAAPIINKHEYNMECVEGGEYNQLYLSDYARVYLGDIKADTITFTGGKRLISKKHLNTYIDCQKAIILNKCVMKNIIGWRGVILRAKEIELNHDYIDENTVYEVYSILKEKKYELGDKSRIEIITVNFGKDTKTYNAAYRNIRKIYKSLIETKRSALNKVKELKSKCNLNIPPDAIAEYTKVIVENIIQYGIMMQFMACMYHSIHIDKFKENIFMMADEALYTQQAFQREFIWDLKFRTSPFILGRKAAEYYYEVFKTYIDRR